MGYAVTTRWDGGPPPAALQAIGFDMGGTSTDVSRYAGQYEHVFESTTAGVTIQAPQLDINTVAAGGGSRLFFSAGVFRVRMGIEQAPESTRAISQPRGMHACAGLQVGPESAGAHPGPVCYRKGGHLAITDANLALGRVLPAFFPHIFGPGEDQPLDEAAARSAFISTWMHWSHQEKWGIPDSLIGIGATMASPQPLPLCFSFFQAHYLCSAAGRLWRRWLRR